MNNAFEGKKDYNALAEKLGMSPKNFGK